MKVCVYLSEEQQILRPHLQLASCVLIVVRNLARAFPKEHPNTRRSWSRWHGLKGTSIKEDKCRPDDGHAGAEDHRIHKIIMITNRECVQVVMVDMYDRIANTKTSDVITHLNHSGQRTTPSYTRESYTNLSATVVHRSIKHPHHLWRTRTCRESRGVPAAHAPVGFVRLRPRSTRHHNVVQIRRPVAPLTLLH